MSERCHENFDKFPMSSEHQFERGSRKDWAGICVKCETLLDDYTRRAREAELRLTQQTIFRCLYPQCDRLDDHIHPPVPHCSVCHQDGHGSEVHEYRVGSKVGRTIYCNDTLIGVMDTPELASRFVRAVNESAKLTERIEDLTAQLGQTQYDLGSQLDAAQELLVAANDMEVSPGQHWVTVNALKDARAENERLKARIAELEAERLWITNKLGVAPEAVIGGIQGRLHQACHSESLTKELISQQKGWTGRIAVLESRLALAVEAQSRLILFVQKRAQDTGDTLLFDQVEQFKTK